MSVHISLCITNQIKSTILSALAMHLGNINQAHIYFRKSKNNVSENERIGNKPTHKGIVLSKIISRGETNLQETIRHMFVVSNSLPRPQGRHSKNTKCLFLHLLIFCILCLVDDTSLPQTSWEDFFLVVVHLLIRAHLHFKHVKEMASVSTAVTVSGRRVADVC